MNRTQSTISRPARQTVADRGGGLLCRRIRSAFTVFLVIAAVAGCTGWKGVGPREEEKGYPEFVKANMAALNRLYGARYEPKPFVVDVDGGSTPIQALIRPRAVAGRVRKMGLAGFSPARQVDRLVAALRSACVFVSEPMPWRPPQETLALERGDCKNLSLALLSLLLAAGLDARGAISHGHMWVEVRLEGVWRVVELDDDSGRRAAVYRIPGFYQRPLYRIYADHSEKRCRRMP